MQRKQSDESSGRGMCCRLIRYVVVKLIAGQKEDKSVKKKLIKKESESDIKIYFKEREDNAANPINTTTVSRSERERVIMLVNGSSDVGSKKMMIHENGKSMASEAKHDEYVRKSHPEPFSNDINKRSHAFIQSRLEKMRKHSIA